MKIGHTPNTGQRGGGMTGTQHKSIGLVLKCVDEKVNLDYRGQGSFPIYLLGDSAWNLQPGCPD